MARRGRAGLGRAGRGKVYAKFIRHGRAGLGMARLGRARLGKAGHGIYTMYNNNQLIKGVRNE